MVPFGTNPHATGRLSYGYGSIYSEAHNFLQRLVMHYSNTGLQHEDTGNLDTIRGPLCCLKKVGSFNI